MLLGSDNDVVDGDVDELDEESDETHQGEPNGCGNGYLLELFPARISVSTSMFIEKLMLPHLSGLVHLFTSLMESLPNCFRGSICWVIWSMVLVNKVYLQKESYWNMKMKLCY